MLGPNKFPLNSVVGFYNYCCQCVKQVIDSGDSQTSPKGGIINDLANAVLV